MLRHLSCIFVLFALFSMPSRAEDETPPAQETTAPSDSSPAASEPPAEPADDAVEPARGWHAGWLRLEGGVMAAWDSGRRSRVDDMAYRVVLDYEVPVTPRVSVGPRVIPFMFWNENKQGNDDIYIAGLGASLRVYRKKDEYRGFFGEVGIMGIAQTNKFEGNSGTFNFMEEIGVGYTFKSDVHANLKIGHISNAGLADHNAGVNWGSIGVGYSFRQ